MKIAKLMELLSEYPPHLDIRVYDTNTMEYEEQDFEVYDRVYPNGYRALIIDW